MVFPLSRLSAHKISDFAGVIEYEIRYFIFLNASTGLELHGISVTLCNSRFKVTAPLRQDTTCVYISCMVDSRGSPARFEPFSYITVVNWCVAPVMGSGVSMPQGGLQYI